MNRLQRSIVLFAILLIMAPGMASAVRKGRLIGRVVDPEGSPVSGVTVTATSDQVHGGFLEILTTDKKGVFKVDFETINVVYKYKFEKVGYVTVQTEQNWRKDGTARHDFIIYPGESPKMDGAPPPTTSSPAIAAFNSGVALYEAKDYAAAEKKFEEAVKHDPELRQAWGALSVVNLAQEKYQEAADAADKAVALGSMEELVLRTRWDAYRNLGNEEKTADARADLEAAGKLAEEAKRIYNEGVKLVKKGDNEGAFAKFQEAADIDPTLRVAVLALATAGLKVDRYQAAYDATEIILETDPENAEALRLRYNASLGIGDENMIVTALVGIAPIEPEVARESLWRLALSAYDANDMARAKRLFVKVIEVDPGRARAYYYLGLICVSDEANEEAKGYLARFVELAPEDPDAATATELVSFLSQ